LEASDVDFAHMTSFMAASFLDGNIGVVAVAGKL
jgi:hypothetical protein